MEKTMSVRNLERIVTISGLTEDLAVVNRKKFEEKQKTTNPEIAKIKIWRRPNGTYDVAAYKKIDVGNLKPKEAEKVVAEVKEAYEKKLHGQKSKDRKKSPKKAR